MSLDWNKIANSFPRDLPLLRSTGTAVYCVSNEQRQGECLETLSKLPKYPNGIHIGVSGWHNYSIIYQTKAQMALLIDFNPSVIEMHRIAQHCILLCKNRHEFLGCFLQVPQVKNWLLNSEVNDENGDRLRKEANRSGNWLSTNEGFLYIQKFYKDNRILFANVDLFDSPTIQKINGWMERNQIFCRTLYISNITDTRWAHGEISKEGGRWIYGKSNSSGLHKLAALFKMNRSIRCIMKENTVVIEASEGSNLSQAIYRGLDYGNNRLILVERHKKINFALRCSLIIQNRTRLLVSIGIIALAVLNHKFFLFLLSGIRSKRSIEQKY